jgi:hypothetical protein
MSIKQESHMKQPQPSSSKTGDKVYATGPYRMICDGQTCTKYDNTVVNQVSGANFPKCACGSKAFFFTIQDETYTDIEDPFKHLQYGEHGQINGK